MEGEKEGRNEKEEALKAEDKKKRNKKQNKKKEFPLLARVQESTVGSWVSQSSCMMRFGL